MTGIKRLSPRQSRKVNTLVKKECCNCEKSDTFDIWGAVGLIRDDRKAGETPSENYQRSIADLGTSAATIHISV